MLKLLLTLLLALSLPCQHALGVTIGDIVRTKGSEMNLFSGIGLVTGLGSTGDSQASTKQVVQQLINRGLIETTTFQDLESAQSSAIVSITCMVPATGCREGDLVELVISALGDAESIAGGRLEHMFLMAPNAPGVPAVEVLGNNVLIAIDPAKPTVARAPQSGKMMMDIQTQMLDAQGRVHLVLDDQHASYSNAHLIASMINDVYAAEMENLAFPVDQKTVLVKLPEWERPNPVAFISPILSQQLPEEQLIGKAVVFINRQDGVILISGNVKVKPVAFAVDGLAIQAITPPIQPTPATPRVDMNAFQGMDPSNLGGTDLQQLVDAFNLLGLDVDKQIAVVEGMHKAGMFHAELKLAN